MSDDQKVTNPDEENTFALIAKFTETQRDKRDGEQVYEERT